MAWKDRNAELEQENRNLAAKITRLETYNETYDKQVKDLTNELVNARHKIAQVEAQNEEAQQNIENQQKEVLKLIKYAELLKNKISRMTKRNGLNRDVKYL